MNNVRWNIIKKWHRHDICAQVNDFRCYVEFCHPEGQEDVWQEQIQERMRDAANTLKQFSTLEF